MEPPAQADDRADLSLICSRPSADENPRSMWPRPPDTDHSSATDVVTPESSMVSSRRDLSPMLRYTSMEYGRDGGRISLHFPSCRRHAARDGTQRAGTRGDRWGNRQLICAAHGRWSGINRDGRGPAGNRISGCKIAGLRLPRFESWSCHNPADLRKRGFHAVAQAILPSGISLRFRSSGR
jgi:hypothetical protein